MNYRHHFGGAAQAVLSASLLVSLIVPGFAQGTRQVTLASGTVIPVKLQDTLSSTESRKGDRFTATLQSTDAARTLDLPVGTMIEGTVSSVRSMQGKEPGVLALNFDRVILPNESSYAIQGSLIGLDSKSVTRSADGRLTAKADQKNKTLVYAGYGAGAGLVLGTLTKGNILLDTLLGGGLGYLFGSLDKSQGSPKDVVLKPNTEMGVRLDRTINISTYDDTRDYNSNPSYHQSRTDRNGNIGRTDRNGNLNRDPYDDRSTENPRTQRNDSYSVLNQYTNLRDNGQPISVLVNGRPVSFLSSARPFISNGVLMVPAIPVLKAEHTRYTYTTNEFKAYGPDETLTGNFGSRTVIGNDSRRGTLPANILRRNGTIFVPMQFLALVTGEKLYFNRDSQTLELGNDSNDTYPKF